MILAKKVRLNPTEEQERQLWKSVGTARWVYNWTLSKQEESYKKEGKFISDGELRKELTQLKRRKNIVGCKMFLITLQNKQSKMLVMLIKSF